MNYHQKFKKMLTGIELESKINCFAINVKSDATLLKRFNFKSVPCVIYYKNNKEFKRCEGMISFSDLKKLFKL